MRRQSSSPVCISEEAFLLLTPVERMSDLNLLPSWWWEETRISRGADLRHNTGDSPSSECPPVHSWLSVTLPLHLLCLLHLRGEEFPQLFCCYLGIVAVENNTCCFGCRLAWWPNRKVKARFIRNQSIHGWCHFIQPLHCVDRTDFRWINKFRREGWLLQV